MICTEDYIYLYNRSQMTVVSIFLYNQQLFQAFNQNPHFKHPWNTRPNHGLQRRAMPSSFPWLSYRPDMCLWLRMSRRRVYLGLSNGFFKNVEKNVENYVKTWKNFRFIINLLFKLKLDNRFKNCWMPYFSSH